MSATQPHLAELRSAQLLAAAARLMNVDGSQAVSMQAVAREAGVSVGLIYRYFSGKHELLLAVILDVLDAFSARVPAAVAGAGEDPVDRLVAAFRSYCEVVDEHRPAVVLTYRESGALDDEARERIKQLEVSTSDPLRECVRDGIRIGVVREVDPDLVASNLLLAAHAWALKHWYFERTMGVEDYVRGQVSLTLHALLAPRARRKYARHLEG